MTHRNCTIPLSHHHSQRGRNVFLAVCDVSSLLIPVHPLHPVHPVPCLCLPAPAPALTSLGVCALQQGQVLPVQGLAQLG